MTITVIKFEPRYRNGKREDWVLYAPRHSVQTAQTWEKVSRLRPPEEFKRETKGKAQHMHAIWSIIGPAYEAWQQGEDIPETGIPLAAWPGLDEGQVIELRKVGLKTVQDVAEMPDGVVDKVKLPNVRGIRRQAQEFLAAREGADLSRKVTEQEEEMKALREKLDAAMELLEERERAEKPKRGRPKKAETQDSESEAA